MSELMGYANESITVQTPAEMAAGIAGHIFAFAVGDSAPPPSCFVLEDEQHVEIWDELARIFGFSTDPSAKQEQVTYLSVDDGRRRVVQRLFGETGDYHTVCVICEEGSTANGAAEA